MRIPVVFSNIPTGCFLNTKLGYLQQLLQFAKYHPDFVLLAGGFHIHYTKIIRCTVGMKSRPTVPNSQTLHFEKIRNRNLSECFCLLRKTVGFQSLYRMLKQDSKVNNESTKKSRQTHIDSRIQPLRPVCL